MLMANIDKGVQKMTSLDEKKGTMNSEYFGFKSQLFQCPPHSMHEQLITVYVKRGGGGGEGVQSKILKRK